MTTADAVRIFNKHVLNPLMLNLAGRKHWYASVIRHTGRRSAKIYATPVVADRVPDGFILPLPYGTDVDWLRNLLASGEAALTAVGAGVIRAGSGSAPVDGIAALLRHVPTGTAQGDGHGHRSLVR